MADTKGSIQRRGLGVGTIFLILFCATFGPLFIRYLLTFLFSSTVIPPAEDVLKGSSSPAALARQIAQAVAIGKNLLVGDRHRVLRRWQKFYHQR
jgi:hypothetical protein